MSAPRTRLLRILLLINVLNMTLWTSFLTFRWQTGIDSSAASLIAATVSSVISVVGLASSFTRFERMSGFILLFTSTSSTLFAGFSLDPVRAGLALFFLAVPIAVAALLFSGRSAIWTLAASVVGMLAVFGVRGDLPIESTVPPLAFVVYFSVITIVATIIKEKIERIHEARLAESAKMASLGLMSAGIAHEINNPLFVLNVAASRLEQMANEGDLDKDKLLDLSAKILDMSQRIEQTVRGMKQFAREASADPLQPARIEDVVRATKELCAHRFAEEDIQLLLGEVPDDAWIACRPVQISQVLVNLLNNAIDAIGQSEARWVRLEVLERKDHWEIAVSDSGPGVPETHRNRIMQPFYTTKGEGKGTGLGLSLSLSIARDHGGRLYLDQESSVTRFVLELPKKQAISPAPAT